jgi:mono/diheme cytochrome c family protein
MCPVKAEDVHLFVGRFQDIQNSTGESMKRFFAVAIVATMAMPLFAADGAATFKAKCAGCHGADGSKAMPAMGVKPLNTPATTGKSEAALVTVVTKGQGKMPAFAGKLSDDEIKAAVAYVKSLK